MKHKSIINSFLVTTLVLSQTITALGAIPIVESITATQGDYVDFIAHPNIEAKEFMVYDITMRYPLLTLNANYPGYTYSVSSNGTVYASGTSDDKDITLSIPTRDYNVTLSKDNYDTITQSINVKDNVSIAPKLIDTVTFIINKGAGSYILMNKDTSWTYSGTTIDGVINKMIVPVKGNYSLKYIPDDNRLSTQTYPFYVEGNYYSYLDTENGYDKLAEDLQDIDNKPPTTEQGAFKKYVVLETQYASNGITADPRDYIYDYIIEGLTTSQPFYKAGTSTSVSTEIPLLEQGKYRVTISKDGYAMKRVTETGVEYYDSIEFTVGPNDPNEEVQYTTVSTPIYVDIREPKPTDTDDYAFTKSVTLKTQFMGEEASTKPESYTFDYIITSKDKIYSQDGIPTNIVAKGSTTKTYTTIELPKLGDYTVEVIKPGYAMMRKTEDKIEYYNTVDFSIVDDGTNKNINVDLPIHIFAKIDLPNKPIEVEQGAVERWVTFETQYTNTGDTHSPNLYEFDYIIYKADEEDKTKQGIIVERGRTVGPNYSIKMASTGDYILEVVKEGFAMMRKTEDNIEYYNTVPFTVEPSSDLINYTKIPINIYKKREIPKPPIIDQGAFVRNITLHSQYENYEETVDPNLYTYNYKIYYNNHSIHGNELATSGTVDAVTERISLPATGSYKIVIEKDGFALINKTDKGIDYYNEIPFFIETSTEQITNLDLDVFLYKKIDIPQPPTEIDVDNTIKKVLLNLTANKNKYDIFLRKEDGSYPYKTTVLNGTGFEVKLPQTGNWIFDISKYGYYSINNLTVNAKAGVTPVSITLTRLSLGDLIDLIGNEVETGIIAEPNLVDNLADKVEELLEEELLDLDRVQDFVDGLLDEEYITKPTYDDLVDELIEREILQPKPVTPPTGGGGGGGGNSYVPEDNDDDSNKSDVVIGTPEEVPTIDNDEEKDLEFNNIADDAIDKYENGEISDEEYMNLLTKAIASKFNYNKAENTIGETDFYITDETGVEITTLEIPTYIEGRDQSTRIAVTDMFGVEGTEFIWNAQDKTCSVEFNNKVFLVLNMNSSKITLNGVEGNMTNSLGQEIIIDNQSGKLTIPIRFFSEKIGFTVGWDGDLRRVTILAPTDGMVETSLTN